MRNLRVAVDIGGTFTDLVAYDEQTHELTTVKTPSTPPGFIDGVMNALAKAGIRPEEMTAFKHGSTIATNAIIERRGAKTGLVTTKGMRDVLGAGRANRPDLFNSNWDPSPPLVPRRNVLTVEERVDYEGNVLAELDEDGVRDAARKFGKRGIESVAVAYLNSFMAPEHELRTKQILQEELGDDVRVCTSAGDPAGDPRVRTHLDHRRQRLPHARDRALSRQPRARPARLGLRGRGAGDPLGRGRDVGQLGAARCRRASATPARRAAWSAARWSASRPACPA